MPNAAIIGTGFYVPERVVTNDELTRYMDTSDEWIRERSGISERRWVAEGTSGVSLACEAARMAIDDSGISKDDIDFIIYATINPDYAFPGNGVGVATWVNSALSSKAKRIVSSTVSGESQ